MKNSKVKLFIRTFFRYLYFRMVRLLDIIFNSCKTPFPIENIRTIILIEVQDIGDTIFASPCIRQIRKRFPDATIHMLVQTKSLDMVQYNPSLNEVFGVINITSYPQLFRVATAYRRKRYDLVISLSPSVRNNLIAALSGGKVISGYLNDSYFLPTNFHDHPIEIRGYQPDKYVTYYKEEHLIVRALKAAAYFKVDLTDCVNTELFLPEESLQFVDSFLRKHKVQHTDLLIGLHPVCLNYFRNWPPEKFAQLGDLLVQHLGNVFILLIGSSDDQKTLDLIISLMKVKDSTICDTTLSILQTASLISVCDVLVGMDSSPSGISGALNVPTVHMHGQTDPKVTGPGGHKNFAVVKGLPCSPCGLNIHYCPDDKKCMKELDVSKVFEATMTALQTYSPHKL